MNLPNLYIKQCAGVLILLLLFANTTSAECRHALALGLDVSGSVNDLEYRLQIEGIAEALDTSKVRRALTIRPDATVDLLVYEWSGPQNSAVILPWTTILNEQVVSKVITKIRTTQRRQTTPGTALGLAMREGATYLSSRSHCQHRTLNLSSDGRSNLGPLPMDVKPEIEITNITINALVIEARNSSSQNETQKQIGDLQRYFKANVIVGSNSFVEIAFSFENYAKSMARKLEKELEIFMLSKLMMPEL